MVDDHALCRHCGHVVRVDWEICFHCGVRRPVPVSLSTIGFRLTTDLLLCCLVIAAVLNVAAVWNVVRGAPGQIVAEVATAARAVTTPAGEALTATPLPGVQMAAQQASAQCLASAQSGFAAARASQSSLGRPTVPTTSLAIVSESADVLCGRPAEVAATGARLLDAAVIARAVAASESIAELDSLEARLRADHPNEPALRDGGLLQRQIAARRSALTRRR